MSAIVEEKEKEGKRWSALPYAIESTLRWTSGGFSPNTPGFPVSPAYSDASFATNGTISKRSIDELIYMADRIYTIATDMDWLNARDKWETTAAVVIRSGELLALSPYGDCTSGSGIEELAAHLDAQAVFAMKSVVVAKLMDKIPPTSYRITLKDGHKIHIYETMQTACKHNKKSLAGLLLIRDLRTALLWTNDAKKLLSQARAYDKALTATLQASNRLAKYSQESEKSSLLDLEDAESQLIQKQETSKLLPVLESQIPDARCMSLVWPCTIALTFVLMGLMVGKLASSMLLATIRDQSYLHLLFLFYLPLACALSAFFLSIIIVGVFQLCGPISQVEENSATYSGQRIANPLLGHDLPHITIQCPVYKEDLWDVLGPTLSSIREAISTYEFQGGTASIVINDDGLRLLNTEESKARMDYYSLHAIGWTARPEHNKDGFIRAGAFKKASNLNFGMRASFAVEKEFEVLATTQGGSTSTYLDALDAVMQASNGQLLAGGDIGLGDLILLVDADTRVPKDCLIDAAKEFHACPSLALLQHASGVLQVSNDFWENGLAHFTKNNYLGTKYVVAGGDSTPFFGHNAFLRLSAICDVAECNHDTTRWWSEEHVSEDFEMSLKLLSAGYTARMAGYSRGEFKEGVCLTVYDEINRWEKYAFGVCELMFNPLQKWFRRGPLTPLMRQFLSSSMDPAAKCSSVFYMWTYFAIGLSWPMCILNYFFIGWAPLLIRNYYVDTLQVLVSVGVIFSLKDALVGPLVMYRLKEAPLGRGLLDAFKYFIIVSLFLQGISIHVSKCLLSHLCGMKMQWGATNKSVENNATMREDLPMIWRRFKYMYVFVSILFLVIVGLAVAVPAQWRITDVKAILPLAWLIFWHAAIPLLMHNRSFLSDVYRNK